MEPLQIISIALGGLLAFVVFWSLIVWFLSRLGGWSKLADVYPSRMPFDETCWSWQSGRLRWGVGYNGILKVCADTRALHLSVLFFFRPGNPPLSIPWEDITGRQRTFSVELRFHRADSVPLRISPLLAERLEEASGGVWHYERRG